jgi:hypothetical protein
VGGFFIYPVMYETRKLGEGPWARGIDKTDPLRALVGETPPRGAGGYIRSLDAMTVVACLERVKLVPFVPAGAARPVFEA